MSFFFSLSPYLTNLNLFAIHLSGNSLLEPSPLLRNSLKTPSSGNFGTSGDIEFMDPAILAVGKGRLQGTLNSPGLDMRSNYLPQVNYLENEARLQLLMQRSQQQNLRLSEIGNTFSQIGDSYGISSRLDQPQVSNLAPFAQLSLQQSRNPLLSNGQWDGWNEVPSGNNLGVAEILRNERLGFNKFYSGYDDSKYRMPNSGDLFNRTFGMWSVGEVLSRMVCQGEAKNKVKKRHFVARLKLHGTDSRSVYWAT